MDDSDALMHVQWLRLLESWRQTLQTPIEINVEQIIGGGQPLTRVNDINITGTLTGTPATALLKPVTITFAWAGTLAPSRGGLGFDASGVDKGGLVVGAAPNTFALKLAGSNAQVLTADSTVAGGVKWATPVTPFNSTPMPILDTPDDNEGAWAVAASGSPARVVTVTGPTGPAGPAGSDSDGSADDAWAFAASNGSIPVLVTSGGTGTSAAFTLGSVVFAGTGGVYAQDNANFFYNVSSVRLGIGTPSPGSILHLRAASFPTLNIEGTTAAGGVLQLTSSTNNWQVYASSGNLKMDVSSAPSGTKFLLSNNGLLQLGTTAAIATATSALFMADGTAPTAGIMPANTGALYVDAFGTSGLFGMDATGIATRLTDAARGRSAAQTAAVASVTTFTLGATDASFQVSSVVTVTTSTTHNFTVAVDYTDETNTAQTLTLTFSQLAGVLVTAITNVTGAGPYEGIPLQIRCKASTAITMKTVGVFTVVVYNVEGLIRQTS